MTLSVHLRRVCLKNGSKAEISRIVQKAKDDAEEVLDTGRVFEYEQLRLILDTADPLTRFVAKTRTVLEIHASVFTLVILMLSLSLDRHVSSYVNFQHTMKSK